MESNMRKGRVYIHSGACACGLCVTSYIYTFTSFKWVNQSF
ncbi:hypothetical protein Hanom_Chr06g00496261 [Helianthus anomalus]